MGALPRGGPGFAAGCESKLTAQLQAYVDSVAPKPSKVDILNALKDPIGYHFSQALAVCYEQRGNPAAAKVVTELMAGGEDIKGFHAAVHRIVSRNGNKGTYHDTALAAGTNIEFLSAADTRTAATLKSGVPVMTDNFKPYNLEAEVVAVTPHGESVQLEFKHATRKHDVLFGCRTNFAHPVRVDAFGNIEYEQVDCQARTLTDDATPTPVLAPKGDAEKITAGAHVAILWTNYGRGTPTTPGRVVWVKRGDDVVWAAGITAK